MINVLDISNSCRRGMPVENKSTGYDAQHILLAYIIIQTELQVLVEVAKLELCLLVGISFQRSIFGIDLLAIDVHSVPATEKIRVVVTKEIHLAFPVVKVE